MKSLLTAIFLTIALGGFSTAQNATPNSNATAQSKNATAPQATSPTPDKSAGNVGIAPGSVIPVHLTKSIDAKKVKSGDEVEAQVTGDLKATNGEIIVPKNTKIVGRVTEAQPRNKEQKESQVTIVFDHLMKNGENMTLPMSIQAIIAPSYLNGGANSSASNEAPSQPSAAPSPAGGGMSGGYGKPAGMGGSAMPANPAPSASDQPAASTNSISHQPITGNTQGVLGISNLKLSTAADPKQGSVLSSEKNNVKLDNGTLLLLRVNQ